MASLWAITSSPYLAASMLFAHGHHRITSEIEHGVIALVFHHDGEGSDHHHDNHHQDQDDHLTHGDDHHLTTKSADVATFPSLSIQVVAKYIPVVSFADIFTAFTQILTLEASHNFLSNEAQRAPQSLFSLRTTVLLI